MPNSLYLVQFKQLTELLVEYQWLWRPMPMAHARLPWSSCPELCEWLSTLDISQAAQWKAAPNQVAEQLANWWPALAAIPRLTDVPEAKMAAVAMDERLGVGVPGRKWAQIRAYLSAVPTQPSTQRYLEWCAGKGYLGRAVAASTLARVDSLEWQQALCEQGQAYAEQHQLPMQFHHLDAFSDAALPVIHRCDHALALHACGDLHVHLLRQAVAADLNAISVSPCCYQLITGNTYQPLSDAGQQAGFVLSKTDLKIAVQEAATGGERVRRQRYQEVTYRLGFDEWQRDAFQSDQYLPLPAIQKSQLNDGFEAFCHWGAAQKGLPVSSDTDFSPYLARGEARFVILEQINVVKSAFRRALELWLALDRVLYLEQHNYHVDLVQFCAPSLTPRNLLIHATRR